MIQRIQYYEVGDDYSEDGRGNDWRVVGNFTTKSVADIFAKTAGNYGHKAQVTLKELVIVDSVNDLNEANKSDRRKAALAKLTDNEKQLLGIKE